MHQFRHNPTLEAMLSFSDAKRRNSHCITDTEFDRAVMTVLACSMVMWLSGALDTVQCVGGAE